VSEVKTASHRESSDSLQPPLRVVGLFAGIGGIETGLHRAGHSSELLCEIEDAAAAVLRARFPSTPLARDVLTLDAIPECDLLRSMRAFSPSGEKTGVDDNHTSGSRAPPTYASADRRELSGGSLRFACACD
jgi:C-5 cytosine-specific DNA methylase